MQITTDSFGGRLVIWDSIIDEIPGGAGLNVTRLDYTKHNANVDKRYIQAGTPVYFDASTRIAEVCKSALVIDGGGATTPRVGKNHHFKVGDFVNDGTTSVLITAIDESAAAYDVLTVHAAITYAAATKYAEGAASGTTAVVKYTPNGVIKSPTWINDGNADVPVVTIGTLREADLTYPLTDAYKIALRGGASQTTSSKSMITVR
jgi:hypothetical protein